MFLQGLIVLKENIFQSYFLKKWKNNKVVLDSWFFFKASIEIDDNQKNIDDLFSSKYFDLKSPNTLRSIFKCLCK